MAAARRQMPAGARSSARRCRASRRGRRHTAGRRRSPGWCRRSRIAMPSTVSARRRSRRACTHVSTATSALLTAVPPPGAGCQPPRRPLEPSGSRPGRPLPPPAPPGAKPSYSMRPRVPTPGRPISDPRQRRAREQLPEHADGSEPSPQREHGKGRQHRGRDDQSGTPGAQQLTPPGPAQAHGPQATPAFRTTGRPRLHHKPTTPCLDARRRGYDHARGARTPTPTVCSAFPLPARCAWRS